MDDVFQEIRELHEEYGVQCFTFNDGSFEDPGKLGKQRVESLSKQIVEYPDRMSFRCFLRAETFQEKDVPLIRLMRKAGLHKSSLDLRLQTNRILISTVKLQMLMTIVGRCGFLQKMILMLL